MEYIGGINQNGTTLTVGNHSNFAWLAKHNWIVRILVGERMKTIKWRITNDKFEVLKGELFINEDCSDDEIADLLLEKIGMNLVWYEDVGGIND